jgi:ketosteroid isomerase-like protein
MTRVTVFFILLFTSSFSFSQQQQTDEQQIKALIQHAFDGVWSDFDAKAVDEYHTPDFLLLEHGEVWTNDIIKGYQVKGRANSNGIKRTNSFEFLKVEVTGSRAWCAYKNFATISKDNEVVKKLEWLESANAIKTPSGWKLILMHSTRVNR